MQNLVGAIDALKVVLQTEAALRQAADMEWATGQQDGPMRHAHDLVIEQVVAAAKNLVNLSNS